MLLNAVRGFCMALADSVPGVSGGTIAFLLGFYDEFINSLNDMIGKDNTKRKAALIFLIKLGIGWVIGFGASVMVLSSLFQAHIYEISSVFLGLTLFAIPLVVKEEWDSIHGKAGCLIFTLAGTVLVFCISYFNTSNGDGISVNFEHLTVGLGLYLFFAAMVAITAMVLPGISGSTLLLIFGLYVPVINAIHEFMHLNFSYFPVLVIFGLGVLTGIIAIIRIIKSCLANYRSQTIYMILGLMIGSLYAIIHGPTTLDVPQPPMNISTFHIGFFILGAVILGALEFLKTHLEKQDGGRK